MSLQAHAPTNKLVHATVLATLKSVERHWDSLLDTESFQDWLTGQISHLEQITKEQ